jgi:hypothetical protein
VPAAILLCLGVGTLCGLLNGLGVVLLRVHPFVITLGTMAVHAGGLLMPTVLETVREECCPQVRERLEIIPTPLGEVVEYVPTIHETMICLGIWAFGLLVYTILVRVSVPVLAGDPMCHALQGQKWRCRAAALIDGNPAGSAEGEVLFTQYGLSGTAVLDVSESLSIAFHRDHRKKIAVALDLVTAGQSAYVIVGDPKDTAVQDLQQALLAGLCAMHVAMVGEGKIRRAIGPGFKEDVPRTGFAEIPDPFGKGLLRDHPGP